MIPRSRPIIILQSVLAGLSALLGGAALADFVDIKVIGLANLFVAAITVGLGVYMSGTNVEGSNVVVAMQNPTTPVAGDASAVTTGKELQPGQTIASVVPEASAPTG